METFGLLGFIFSIIAMSQVSGLKKEIEKLKAQIGSESNREALDRPN